MRVGTASEAGGAASVTAVRGLAATGGGGTWPKPITEACASHSDSAATCGSVPVALGAPSPAGSVAPPTATVSPT